MARYSVITVCLTDDESARVRAAAAREGTSLSRYVHAVLAPHVAGLPAPEVRPKLIERIPAPKVSITAAASERVAMPPRAQPARIGGGYASDAAMTAELMGDPCPGRSALDRRS